MTNYLDVHCTYTFTFVCVQCINLYIYKMYMCIYFRCTMFTWKIVRVGEGGGCGGGILSLIPDVVHELY